VLPRRRRTSSSSSSTFKTKAGADTAFDCPVAAMSSLPLILALVLIVHQPAAFAVSRLDQGHGYQTLSPRSDEANAAAYARKYGDYGRLAAPEEDVRWANYGLETSRHFQASFAPPPQKKKIDIHVVAHTHDDVGWLSTVFA